MTVFIFGNPDLPQDALPLRLMPELRAKFPSITFAVKDPNEEWDVPPHLVVIDTVVGIDHVQEFEDLQPFVRSPRVSLHDFDALAQLRFLQKLGKLQQVTVIGVPPTITSIEASAAVTAALSRLTDTHIR